jgi:HD-like signal output (HDOD) protein
MVTKKELQSKIEQITNLPTLPTIVTRVMQIVNNPSSSASDVAFMVGQDIVLSAKILRLANSVFYGMPRAITSINNAVVILGLKVINTIVLSLTVFDLFPHEKKTSLFNRTAFWRHSTSCALICRFLTERLKKFVLFDEEEAFCAGLLHDIGKVVMEQYLHDDFHKALKYAKHKKVPLFEAEIETLGYAHTDVAQWLTSRWQLPPQLQFPIVHHHAPQRAKEHPDIVALCHYADFLCYELKLTIDEDYTPPALVPETAENLEIKPEDIEELKNRLTLELERVNIFCDIAAG